MWGCWSDADVRMPAFNSHTQVWDNNKKKRHKITSEWKTVVVVVVAEGGFNTSQVLVQGEEEKVEGCSINLLNNLQAHANFNINSKHTRILLPSKYP